MADNVNSPAHYRGKTWECIDIIRALNLDYWRGNVLKYIARHRNKGGAEDIAKAMWYLRNALSDRNVLISLSYNLPSDPDAAAKMTGLAIAENFGLADKNLVAAITEIVVSANQAYTKGEIEDTLVSALSLLRAYLDDIQEGGNT